MDTLNPVSQEKYFKIISDTILFFDMDGTLIDTDFANFCSYNKAVKSVLGSDYNLTFDPNKRLDRTGLKYLIANLSETDLDLIIKEKETCYYEFLSETKLNEDIVNILFKYCSTNLTVLVTNCREDRALMILNHHGIMDRFNYIFCRQFVINDFERVNKFQNAIKKLDISPNVVIAFENEEIEILDAQEAGIEIINPKIYNYEEL
ncbi:HAD hydrolase-like protein [Sphingobacterium sp. UBA6320]|uniref:HAD hydrolase-like protein n=1 Tax=Sphingobacterium sp. UBA6320 TaxID=1947510 RepID=UPI0025F6F4EB|nr:HAD hydrolase-like protein [Sphingobacterium sp. UBA6320]